MSTRFVSHRSPGPANPAESMRFPIECPLCGGGNVGGAHFCMHCGSPVHLMACPQCDAINARDAAFCYKCHGSLVGGTSAEREPSLDVRGSVRGMAREPPTQADNDEIAVPIVPEARPAASPQESLLESAFAATPVRPARLKRSAAARWTAPLLLAAAAAVAAYAYWQRDPIVRTVTDLRATFEGSEIRRSDSAPGPAPKALPAATIPSPTLAQPERVPTAVRPPAAPTAPSSATGEQEGGANVGDRPSAAAPVPEVGHAPTVGAEGSAASNETLHEPATVVTPLAAPIARATVTHTRTRLPSAASSSAKATARQGRAKRGGVPASEQPAPGPASTKGLDTRVGSAGANVSARPCTAEVAALGLCAARSGGSP